MRVANVESPGIKVTPEMLKAGASVLYEFETLTAGEEYWARRVYEAMVRADTSTIGVVVGRLE